MDIRELNQLAEATKNMSEEERNALIKMFSSVQNQVTAPETSGASCGTTGAAAPAKAGAIPNGPTERIVALKENFLKQVPTITTHRAKAITKINRENPGTPKIRLRGQCFKVLLRNGSLGDSRQRTDRWCSLRRT